MIESIASENKSLEWFSPLELIIAAKESLAQVNKAHTRLIRLLQRPDWILQSTSCPHVKLKYCLLLPIIRLYVHVCICGYSGIECERVKEKREREGGCEIDERKKEVIVGGLLNCVSGTLED